MSDIERDFRRQVRRAQQTIEDTFSGDPGAILDFVSESYSDVSPINIDIRRGTHDVEGITSGDFSTRRLFEELQYGLGEITRVNALREALDDANTRYRQEQLDRQRQIEALREQDRLTALQSSLAASRGRSRSGGSRGTAGSGGITLGADRDFLGL